MNRSLSELTFASGNADRIYFNLISARCFL